MQQVVYQSGRGTDTITSLLDWRWREEATSGWCSLVDFNGVVQEVSVDDLMRRAMGYAAVLGPVKRQRKEVGICLYHSLDLHAAFVGALWAGHIPMMLAPPSRRMEAAKYSRSFSHTLQYVQPSAVVLDAEIHQRLKDSALGRFLDAEILDPTLVEDLDRIDPWPAQPDEVALIQHSSGTTGLQKGVALSHQAVINHHRTYADRLGMTTDDVIVSWLPLYHDMGFIACFLLPLLGRMRVVELSPFDWVRQPSLLLIQIHKHQGTLCWLPNFAYPFMAQSIDAGQLPEGLDLSCVRAWINCSEPISHSSEQEFLAAFGHIGVHEGQFTASYAMAENVFAVTQSLPGKKKIFRADRQALLSEEISEPESDADEKILVSNGCPVEGTYVCILDEADQPLPERRIGQIAIKGHTLFSGYYRRADLTAAVMTVDGWYRTGDIGFLHQGEVFVTGRKKDLIVVQGRKFYPSDIEEVACRVEGVAPGRAVAFGLPDEVAGTEVLVVLAEPEQGWAGDPRRLALAIRKAVAQEFDCTAGTVRIVAQRSLVKSSSGKMARADNREKLKSGGFSIGV